jgi:AcrR family transcriptional regulator
VSEPVKRNVKRNVKRRYDSPLRRAQAAGTRQRILEAAAELFDAQGYGRTTVRQIADAAGVAADTVYATFGAKARVLTALIDSRLAPAGEASLLDRPEVVALRDEPDQRHQIRLFAHDIAAMSARVRPVFEVLRTAAAVDADMAAVHAEMEGYRVANMRRAAEWIAAHGPLRAPVERVADTLWALASPDVARLLCVHRGWTDEQYAEWLADTLIRALLPDEPDEPGEPTPAPRAG